MNALIFLIGIIISSFGVFIIPKNIKHAYTLFINIIITFITSWFSLLVLINGDVIVFKIPVYFWTSNPEVVIDKLSAFFILVINFTVLTGLLYSKGYLQQFMLKKSKQSFSLHYFAFIWFHISMLLVLMLRDGVAFLMAWELMSLSSFILVIFNAETKTILKTGISYLVQMHVGFVFLLIAFIILNTTTGEMSFTALNNYFASHSNISIFLMFFTGFGIKAGFIPLHTWLPMAHPAAPSHVSGIMSGVMIKIGIYGILRVLTYVHTNTLWIGIFILIISLVSGLLGVMMAIMQHDLKKLLAYHSIENIGIIGIGIGLGMIGIATNQPLLALLGFTGGILHILNHSLFKSLLFFTAGSVYKMCHTNHIEDLGGLMKKMPQTALLFLLGSLAICGLPPLNGFISEYIIYLGLFKGLNGGSMNISLMMIASIVGLALIGGLAIFCFTKAFGVIFLGEARSDKTKDATEVGFGMLFPLYMIALFIIAIGLLPVVFVKPIFSMISSLYNINIPTEITIFNNLQNISIVGGVFIIITVVILLLRQRLQKNKVVTIGDTWGCGYTAITSKHQYTATSYADNYGQLAQPILNIAKHMPEIAEEEIFPVERTFASHHEDTIYIKLIQRPVYWIMNTLRRLAVLQSGQIQHYILYAFLFIILIFILTFFKLI